MNVSARLALHPQGEQLTPRGQVKAMLNTGARLSRIAVEAGVKPKDLRSWLDGVAAGEETDSRLIAWLEDLDQSQADDPLPYVETQLTQSIRAAFNYGRETPTIVVIYGAAGASKTKTAEQETNNNRDGHARRTFYLAASVFTRTPSAIIFKIAEAVEDGRPLGLTVGAYRAYQLVQSILRMLSPGDLLIIDEAQHLEAAALDAIRIFHDEPPHIGIAYLGNEAVYSRISGKGRRAEFAQLSSRIGLRLHVEAPQEGDVDTILQAWGISGAPERQLLHHIARGPGGLRQLSNVVRQSRIVAHGMKRPLDAQVMRAAAEALGITE